MKEAKRHRKFILVVFGKKFLLRVNLRVVVWPKMLCPQNSGSAPQDLYIILHNGRGEEAFENQIMIFLKTFYST